MEPVDSNSFSGIQPLSHLQDSDPAKLRSMEQSSELRQEITMSILKETMEAPKQVLKLLGNQIDTLA